VIIATDVLYDEPNDAARAAGVVFSDWKTRKVAAEYVVPIQGIQPYEPGAFYKRELPCLLALLAAVKEPIHLVVVDSYVDLGPGHPGLGRHLYDALKGETPVVGVAKSHFAGAEGAEVLRGDSSSPLYVTAAGIDVGVAADAVREMHGPHRIPTLLKLVDSLSRGRSA
jgi:deoxyribonuclease V